uniref:Uncharacterized protein n=1 Tax=Rhipicephalus appendiculatus TaxID=34631 RepID=A0A131YEW0_RHIAP
MCWRLLTRSAWPPSTASTSDAYLSFFGVFHCAQCLLAKLTTTKGCHRPHTSNERAAASCKCIYIPQLPSSNRLEMQFHIIIFF